METIRREPGPGERAEGATSASVEPAATRTTLPLRRRGSDSPGARLEGARAGVATAQRNAAAQFQSPIRSLLRLTISALLRPQSRRRLARLIAKHMCAPSMRGSSIVGEPVTLRAEASVRTLERFGATSSYRRDAMRLKRWHRAGTQLHSDTASHDALTGLPNLASLKERLHTALRHSSWSGPGVGLLYIDLDGLGLIEQVFGRQGCHAVLQVVAPRLAALIMPGHFLARMEGDAFIVLSERPTPRAAASALAERILDGLRAPIEFSGHTLFVTASIGIAVGHGRQSSADQLLRSAATAMFTAKEKGYDGWQFATDKLEHQARLHLNITHGLRTAIERAELSVRFQPIVGGADGRIVAAEMLLRWHPRDGEIAPGLFIPIAEMSCVIVSIGAWVFLAGCRAEADWRRRWGEAAPYLSLNLSARQLNEANLAETFAAILLLSGANPTRIMLEITETALMSDIEGSLRVLDALVRLGMRVAVDDFGTGYSSLAQLTRLPVNVLKIDKALIDGIEHSEASRGLIAAVICVGRAFNLQLCAEGVENAGQLQILRDYACDLIQGFFLHRPLDADQFIATVERDRQARCAPTAMDCASIRA